MSDRTHAVVIDNGSAFIRAGFAGHDSPEVVFRSVLGRSANKGSGEISTKKEEIYIGDEALGRRTVLTLKVPIEQRIITNWDEMEMIWHHTFYSKLKVDPKNVSVLITEPPLNPKATREKMTEIMFENFEVYRFFVAIQPLLALYASERITGVVLDSGDGVTHSVAIYEGNFIPHATLRLEVGGKDVTDYMRQLLVEKGCSFNGMDDRRIAEDIKEKLCYVALDFDDEMELQKSDNKMISYQLPNDEIISIGSERLRCPEILFTPSFVGNDDLGCHEMVFETVNKCDLDIRSDLLSNIVLCGGSTMFEGFSNRLQKEVVRIAKPGHKIKVVASPGRNQFAWKGGSTLAQFSTFQASWITNEEYQESGPTVVHRKCF